MLTNVYNQVTKQTAVVAIVNDVKSKYTVESPRDRGFISK